MSWRSAALALPLALAVAAAAWGQEAQRLILHITVTHASANPGGVDPGAEELHKQLQRDFRYRSLRVLESRSLTLAVDEIGQMKLPNGRWVRVRPLSLSGDRVLVATEVQGAGQMDLRMHNHKPVVIIYPEAYEEGRLVISFEPAF